MVGTKKLHVNYISVQPLAGVTSLVSAITDAAIVALETDKTVMLIWQDQTFEINPDALVSYVRNCHKLEV